MFSAESSGIGATVCTAGRFLLVAPFTKLEDEEEDEDPESTAPVPKIIVFSLEYKLIEQNNFHYIITEFGKKNSSEFQNRIRPLKKSFGQRYINNYNY